MQNKQLFHAINWFKNLNLAKCLWHHLPHKLYKHHNTLVKVERYTQIVFHHLIKEDECNTSKYILKLTLKRSWPKAVLLSSSVSFCLYSSEFLIRRIPVTSTAFNTEIENRTWHVSMIFQFLYDLVRP